MSEQWNNRGPSDGAGQQGPYGQDASGQQYPQDQYGQPSDQQPQYGQPSDQQPQYGQPQGQYPPQGQYQQQDQYPPQGQYQQQDQQWAQGQQMYGSPYGYATPPATKSSILGIVGLGIVVLSLIALVIAAWSFGQGLAVYILDVASTGGMMSEDELLSDPLTQAYAESAVGTILAIVMASLIGLAGWIVSIVATVQRRGRAFGIAGIVLGVLSWGFGYAAFMAALLPALEQMGI